ncbi:MAG: hypothetical protein CM1200mP2_28110 [Planctomycetaceae bacterium]|nr:MAG: hypothetical protein CM1200mP2_28110 [Planctomycetaceae bacterium]
MICDSRKIPLWVCALVICPVVPMGLQAEGPSKTPLTDRAVEQIRRQAKHMALGAGRWLPSSFRPWRRPILCRRE